MVEISEELWKMACENMAQASKETVEMFGAQITFHTENKCWEKVKELLEYIASDKFLEEEQNRAD